MKGARLHSWGGDVSLEELTAPEAGEDEVLVAVDACGVGLTVLNYMRGDLGSDPADLPRVPGHELIGRVLEVGPGVDERRVGELVGGFFYLFCARCAECLAGRENLCRRVDGFIGVSHDGGYAERVSLPARNAVALPEGLDPVEATVINDAVASPIHIVDKSQIGAGHRVAVIGAGGGLGIHMIEVARVYGAEVVGLDVAPDKQARRYARPPPVQPIKVGVIIVTEQLVSVPGQVSVKRLLADVADVHLVAVEDRGLGFSPSKHGRLLQRVLR